MPFKTIMLPVDGSESAMHAGRLALELARVFSSRVHVMHCYDTIPGTIGGEARERIAERETAESCDILIPYRVMFDQESIPCDLHIMYGNVAQAAITVVKEKGCDLVVMGHRGLGSAEGFMLGSVSQKVLELCPVPVLVAR